MGFSPLSLPPSFDNLFLACSLSHLRPSPLFMGVRRCYLRSLVFSFFVRLLTAFLAALSFSVLSRLDRLFCRPACFCSLRGQAVASPAFCRLTSTSGALVSAGLWPPFPWPPVSRQVASLTALCVYRLLGRSACRFLGRSVCRLLRRSL